MYCSQCGARIIEGANFCAQCGAPVAVGEQDVESTTAAIDVGALDPTSTIEGVPTLEPGTGMLVVVRGPNAGDRFLLDRDRTTVGRHPDSDIFLHDVTVSRRHSELLREGRTFALRDLGSLNGSYVNGVRVDERVLESGDEVQIGRFKLLFLGAPEDASGSGGLGS
ncbi:MAG: FHA domain-containing protein [Nitriliruptorales bacterium]